MIYYFVITIVSYVYRTVRNWDILKLEVQLAPSPAAFNTCLKPDCCNHHKLRCARQPTVAQHHNSAYCHVLYRYRCVIEMSVTCDTLPARGCIFFMYSLTAVTIIFVFFSFISHPIKCQLSNMFKIKRDTNQQNFKIVDLHFVNS